ncbi:transcription initiation factor IIF subunit alpha [Physcomitrium patens]|uniref:Transcription initiation factor IIF subunit alpha n=1 Tax=Physcomitrium patens TaxID=3218 RepID=A0A2K1KSY4_PHYPA|nr:transcription initiation factor IIF subunit alpha-like [Physcomitrium patens]XP_024370614.1 transcription initiation factor IIF subunit alpha-like [Physcomitrium patens]XP_024370615.1 transcription initiation factor IIF subunit alpha-like [Physcomitrium patens]PNR56904.1 hypothetical protein PHYPA_003896 [Physcomitrium patens]|eukprot:XP_024370613.1 transcription initiation factor IIF subunit alpha-like [Physcomitrella patens]
MSPLPDLVLKDSCTGCRGTADLYGSNCGHLTLCLKCGKSMAETQAPCSECGTPVTRLIREYNVRANTINKQHFIGRFLQGQPMFSKKKSGGPRWSLQREGLTGRQLSEAQREKFKQKLWILEDDIGLQQFQGQLEGGQQATYFTLSMHGSEFTASPAGAWYNFNKVAHYKQLTLEEAEEQMKNRRKTADGYQRWMMKASNPDIDKLPGSGGAGGGRGRKVGADDDDMGSDKGEDEDEEFGGKKRLNLNKTAKGGDDDGEDAANDIDMDEEEPERGDDWEHEETFTDDDEAVGNDPEEREEQVPEGPAPPEIKQEEEDEEDEKEGQQNEEGQGGLSKSGRELKKLLGKQGFDDSDGGDNDKQALDESDGDDDVDLDNDEVGMSPVLAPALKKKDAPKETPAEPTPAKAGNVKSAAAGSSKGKRKAPAAGDDTKLISNKKAKAGDADKGSKTAAGKKESNKNAPAKGTPAPASAAAKPAAAAGNLEDEVKAFLRQTGPVKSNELVTRFKNRLKSPEDKSAFAAMLKRISRIDKKDGVSYIVLR